MSRFMIGHLSYFTETEPKVSPLKIGAPIIEAVSPVIEAVSPVAKIAICAIGATFQAAKTLVKIPFAVVLVPFGYILEKIADCLIANEVGVGQGMKKFAQWIDPQFSKDVIMTVHLVHFTFNTNVYPLKDVFDIVSDVLCSRGEYYDRSARSLWSEYIYGNALPDPKPKVSEEHVLSTVTDEKRGYSHVSEEESFRKFEGEQNDFDSIEEKNHFYAFEGGRLSGLQYDIPYLRLVRTTH